MNVVMFTNVFKPFVGGVSRSVATFAENLRDMGDRVLVVTLEFPDATESGEDVFRLPALKEFAGSGFSLRLPLPAGLHDRLESFSPDIVHSHHPFMLGDTALRVAKWRNIPLVFTHHTLYENYTYRFGGDSAALEEIARSMATEYANLCDLAVAPTPSIARIIKKRGVEVPVEVIPTGIDLDQFANGDRSACREAYGIPDEAFVMGYLGRVVEEKNVTYLARAAARVLKNHPDAWYLIAGDGEEGSSLETFFENEGVADRVVMTGNLTGPDIANAYAAMDLFLFASKTDTQGIVILESLCAGTPVVALEATGPKDIIEPGKSGFLLPEDADATAFAEQIERLKNDPEKRRIFRDKSCDKAWEFDRRLCAARLFTVYRRLISAQRERSGNSDDILWERLQHKFGAEWDLLKGRLSVFASTFLENNSNNKDDYV